MNTKKLFWYILLTSIFTILGIVLILFPKDDQMFRVGVLGSSFFGFCTLTFIYFYFSAKKFNKEINQDIIDIQISGEVKFLIDKRKLYFLGIIFFILGLVFIYADSKSLFAISVSIGLISLGVFVFFGTLFGLIGNEFLCFEFDGIKFGNRNYSYLVRWENIMNFSTGEYNSNSAIFINLINPEDCSRYLYVHKGNREKTIKKLFNIFSNNLAFVGCHVLILPQRFSLSTAYVFKVIEKYLQFPESRKELKNKLQIEK